MRYNVATSILKQEKRSLNNPTVANPSAGYRNYPPARRAEQLDDYHGTAIADPYRWLEDADSEETLAWIKAQNELTFAYLSAIPCREHIHKRFTELWDYPKMSAPFKRGERYFQFRNSGLQNQDVLFTMERLGQPGRMLLDPNTLSAEARWRSTVYP